MERFSTKLRKLAMLGGMSIALLLVFTACDYFSPPFSIPTAPSALPKEADEGGETTQRTTITFAVSAVERSMYEDLSREFEAANPTASLQLVDLPDFSLGEFTALASAADTFVLPFRFQGGAGNAFLDLQSLVDADPTFDFEDFWPGLLDGCRDASGKLLGIPLSASLRGIFYDLQAFEAAGLPPPAPGWTWDDFRHAAASLAAGEGESIRYGFVDGPHLSASVLAPQIDAHLAANDGAIDSSLAQALDAELQWYIDLAQANSIYPILVSQEPAGLENLASLFQGQTKPAMWVGSLSEAEPGTSTGLSPDDPFAGLALQNWGFAPFPVEPGAEGGASPVSLSCAAISAGSRQPRLAWDWLAFLSRQRLDPGRLLADRLLRAPARRSVAEASGYWDLLPEQVQSPARFVLEHAWPGTRFPQAMETLNRALGQALSGETGLFAALDSAVAAVPGETAQEPASTAAPVVVATPEPSPAAEQDWVRFYSLALTPFEQELMRELVETYNQSHPGAMVRLSLNYSLPEDLNFMKALSNQYDCFTWYEPNWNDLGEADLLLSLNAFMETEPVEFLDDFYPGQLEIYRNGGELYGLPGVSQPRVMYYNAGLLDRLGIPPPSPDWTFDEFLELVLQVSEQEVGEPVYGYLFEEWEDLLFAGRGVALDEEGSDPVPRAAFDSPEMLAFLEWLRDLARSQVIQVAYDRSISSVVGSLSEGRIAFWPAMAGNPGDRYSESDDFPPYPTGVLPFPRVQGPSDTPGDEGTPGALWNRGYYISSGSKNPPLCWDWLKYLSEQPRNLQGVPARRSVAESTAWEAVAGVEEARVFRQAVEQHIPGRYNFLTGPYYTWRHQAVLAALGDENLRETLSDLQFKADAYTSCITQVDTARLNYSDLLDQISTCARQADPTENWP